ncbi:UNVERIFIED_CONTAM: hypothetical protein GTU68_054407 [Idotea baltica]|nr:hypothetical protein [Idotea baltica]
MDTIPETKLIRDMHAKNLAKSKEKLFEFLVGWSGGPQLYVEKYGHPRLRMRHMPFSIGEEERDQWLLCMKKALDDSEIGSDLKEKLFSQFAHIADFMRNKES